MPRFPGQEIGVPQDRVKAITGADRGTLSLDTGEAIRVDAKAGQQTSVMICCDLALLQTRDAQGDRARSKRETSPGSSGSSSAR